MEALEHEADVSFLEFLSIARLEFVHYLSAKLILPREIGVVHAQDVEKGRFPRSGWTHDRDEFAFRDRERDVAQDVDPAGGERVRLFEVTNVDHWVLSGSFFGRVRRKRCRFRREPRFGFEEARYSEHSGRGYSSLRACAGSIEQARTAGAAVAMAAIRRRITPAAMNAIGCPGVTPKRSPLIS